MRSVTPISALLAGLCLAAGAAAQTGQQPTTPTSPSTGAAQTRPAPATQPGTPGKAESAIAKADRDFMRQAAQNGLAEVQASKLAQEKATQPDIKSFAGKMVAEHTKANEELKALAAKKGVSLPTDPSLAQRARLKMLEGADGEKFDQRYAENFGVEAHEDTIKLFRKASTEAKDADVKAFAQKTLPNLQEHLTLAKAAHAAVEPSAAGKRDTAGSTERRAPGGEAARTDRADKAQKQQ